jgi:hypothetical protein
MTAICHLVGRARVGSRLGSTNLTPMPPRRAVFPARGFCTQKKCTCRCATPTKLACKSLYTRLETGRFEDSRYVRKTRNRKRCLRPPLAHRARSTFISVGSANSALSLPCGRTTQSMAASDHSRGSISGVSNWRLCFFICGSPVRRGSCRGARPCACHGRSQSDRSRERNQFRLASHWDGRRLSDPGFCRSRR